MNHPSPAVGGLGDLGPFSTVDFHTRNSVPNGPWQPLTRLLQTEGVRERIRQVRNALATTRRCDVENLPWRVAASVAHLGLVARLIAPRLGVLTLGLGSLNIDPGETWWQPVVGGPVPLSVSVDALTFGSVDARLIADGVVRTLTELFAAESVSPRVLWGNVASAINGSYNAIAAVRPELSETAHEHVLNALDHPLLAGASNRRPGLDFKRTSCCLIYRLGPTGTARQLCGDCVLRGAS